MKRICTCLLVLAVASLAGCARKPQEAYTLTVQSVIGSVTVTTRDGARQPGPGDSVGQDATVVTGDSSLVDLVYGLKGVIRINENSTVSVARLFGGEAKGQSRLDMARGKVFVAVSKLSKGESFEVASPTTIAAVRGTSFRVVADENSSRVDVLSGKIKVNPVKEGQVVKEFEVVVEKDGTVSLDRKEVTEIMEQKKDIEVETLKPEEAQEIREELKDIAPAEKSDDEVKQEIRQVMLAPPADDEAIKKEAEEREKADAERKLLEQKRLKRDRLARMQAEKERIEKQKQETKEKRVKNIPNL